MAAEHHPLEYFRNLLLEHEKAIQEDQDARDVREAAKAAKADKKKRKKDDESEGESDKVGQNLHCTELY